MFDSIRKATQWGQLVLVLFSLMTTVGCSTLYKLETDFFVAPMVSEMVEKASDSENLRVVKEGLASNIVLITSLSRISPNNRRLLQDSAFLYCAYGMTVEHKEPGFAAELYDLGAKYGMRALKTNRRFEKALAKGKQIPEAVECLGEGYAEELCWTGLNTGLWILRNMEDTAALIRLADALALVKRSIELDEDYFYGVGKAFLGAYYAQVPEFLGTGGGPEASRKMFAEARAVSDDRLLLVDVYEARFLLTQIKDRKGYKQNLKRVLAADPDILEGRRAFTAMAKKKATYFLKHMEKYF